MCKHDTVQVRFKGKLWNKEGRVFDTYHEAVLWVKQNKPKDWSIRILCPKELR